MFEQIMIIEWPWEELEGNKEYDIVNIHKYKKGAIIRLNKKRSKKALTILFQLITKYLEAKIFIFLHRRDGYTDSDVKTIIKKNHEEKLNPNLLKCFLISGDSDFIYFNTQMEGLLGGKRRFQNGELIVEKIDKNGVTYEVKEYFSVLKGEQVKKKHFKAVWEYYEHEFRLKIKALKIDLLRYLVEFSESNTEKNKIYNSLAKEKLKNNRKLKLRLDSFLGIYAKNNLDELEFEKKACLKEEIKELREYEINDQTSYHLDDCNANLKNGAWNAYDKLVSKLKPIFLEEESPKSSITLIEIRDLFDRLILTFNPKK